MKVKFVKQWRGHDVGAEPELTDERAGELIREGYAVSLAEIQPEPETETQPEPEPEPAEELIAEEHPRPRSRRKS